MEENKRVKGKMGVVFFEDGSLDTEFEGDVPLERLNPAMFKLRRDFRLKYSVLKSVVHKEEMKHKQEEENKNEPGRESENNATVE